MGILMKCLTISLVFLSYAAASSHGGRKLTDKCLTDGDCEAGLFCSSCLAAFSGSKCVRSTATNLFKLVNYSLPYNKYAYLTTHNSFAITGKTLHPDAEKLRLTFTNQEDSVTNQLNNGVRALMLDTYDYQNDVWLCHSRGGICRNVTAFTPAINTFKEIEAFLAANPSEIVTIILEDYVKAKNGLTNVFKASGLSKYWFPCSEMPANGRNWPSVSDMIGKNQRLVVFTSMQSKQAAEGIAYQWNYMVENNYKCLTDGDCEAGLFCSSCLAAFSGSKCVRSTATNLFKLVNYSLPYNKYAYLTTHNSFAITGKTLHPDAEKLRLTFTNQEDSVTNQLNNGVRALMLDTYDYQNDVWLCHSRGGVCRNVTAFTPAINTFKEIEVFLAANPSEIVTIILEDYVKAKNGLTNVFKASGLSKYWFPCSEMPANGKNWPSVSDMIGKNQRLVVFTSMQSKQAAEGIAYQWKYMVENNYGDTGMKSGMCSNRRESSPLTDKKKSLVMVNYFPTIPVRSMACKHNSQPLLDMLRTCNGAASNRWANFVVVDYYKRSMGGGSFQATDMCNGRLLCGRDDVHVCNAHP